jgi:hypothetical protein
MFNTSVLNRLLAIFMFVALLAMTTACGKEDEGRRPPPPPPDDDVTDVVETPDTTPPPPPDTGPTGPPGFMHGEWEVRKVSDEEHIYTLQLVHIDGETTVTGTYTFMATGATGRLSPGSWRQDVFEINWTRLVQGGERTFGIVGAEKQTDDLLLGRHNDRICLCTYDVHLIRKP